MCYAAYIGANYRQVVSPFIADETALYLQEPVLEKERTGLRNKFTRTYIDYIGSHPGCSCGFANDPTNFDASEKEDAGEKDQALASCNALLSLIGNLTKEERVEFYWCLEGDWHEPVQACMDIDISGIKLGQNYFGPAKNRFIVFGRQADEYEKLATGNPEHIGWNSL